MNVCTCFMLFGIFAYTNSTTRNRTKVYQRSINPEIENVSGLSSEEYSGDTKNFKNVHYLIAKETTASDKNKNQKHILRAARTETLTYFIQKAVKILNTYEDTAFEDFFHILDTEIRRYHYRDCKFSELTQNEDTRSFLAGAINIIREKSVSFKKANINKIAEMMRDETYGNDVKTLLGYINSLYIHNEQKFHRVLEEIKQYRKIKSIKAHKNLIMVIRSEVRDILFDHYTALDSNTRRELKERIEKFWKNFKKNSASNAEVNYSYEMNDAVSKPVISSIKVSENVMNKNKDPEHYSKNNPQENFRNKRDRKSKDKYYQQPQDREIEKEVSSNESKKRNTDTDTPDEISSGQSFDSSSNSIKQSQERQAEYNTNRYLTLYTEKMFYKSRTTKKTEVVTISVNEMNKRATVPRRPTTTTAPTYSSEDESVESKNVDVLSSSDYSSDDINDGISYSNHDTESVMKVKSKPEPKITQDNKQRKLSTPDKPKSTFRYDTVSYQRSVIQTKSVPTKTTIQFQRMRAGSETRSMKPALTKTPSTYSKPQESIYLHRLSNTRRNNKLAILPEDDDFIKKQKLKFLTRQNANGSDLNVPKNFNEYIIKRLDTLEQDLQDFRSMLYDNQTHEVEFSNVTDKFEAKNKIENKRKQMKYDVVRLKTENHDLNKEGHNKENNVGQSTRSNTMNTESSTNNTSYNPNVTNRNTTVIDNKNTSQVTSNNLNNNKELNKDKIDNTETTVTVNSSVKVIDSKGVEYFETTPDTTSKSKRRTLDYANIRYLLAHINDGLDLHM